MLTAALAACAPEPPQLDPDRGSVRGGEIVHVEASGLRGHGAVVVWFGGEPARGVVIESDDRLRAVSPPGSEAGPVDVRLEFADGTELAAPAVFSYVPGVLILPPRGSAAGG